MRTALWTLIGILSALVAVAAGCEGRMPAQAEGRGIVRPALGFALDVPPDWSFRDLSGDVVLEISPAASAAARATPVIHVTVIDREGLSLDAWADQAVAAAKETTTDLEVVSRKPAKLADGREALSLELRNPRGVRPLVQRMLLALTDTRAYAVIATTPDGDLASVTPAFDKCFTTFVVW
jgi:hypothetical protein